MIDPEVGASTCASGNHICKGTIGILIPKPIKNAKKIINCLSVNIYKFKRYINELDPKLV